MKSIMEKEQILSTLTEKLGNTSFSQQSLQTYVENNLPAQGTEPDDAYWTRHVNVLKSFQGQFNHDVAAKVTEQSNAKFEEYKKNWKPTEQTPPPSPAQQGGGSEELNKLSEQIEALKKQFESAKNAQTQSELLAKVKEQMQKQNASDAYVLDKTLQGVSLDATKSIDELTREMLQKYDTEYKACRGDGAVPRTSASGEGQGKSFLDQMFEAKKRKNEARK